MADNVPPHLDSKVRINWVYPHVHKQPTLASMTVVCGSLDLIACFILFSWLLQVQRLRAFFPFYFSPSIC